MGTNQADDVALTRLMQLVSASLPIGGYSYSQGIEWAVENGWISDAEDLEQWLAGLLGSNLLYVELPLLRRMMTAWAKPDEDALTRWNDYLLASRETVELRQEESNRGRAFFRVLSSLEDRANRYETILIRSQLACYSFACQKWHIPFQQAGCGLSWTWLENLVLSAVKLIPLGQTEGQQTLFKLSGMLPQFVNRAESIADHDMGASSMALAIASSGHETQYTRLFRS